MIQTVNGTIDSGELGRTLMHEHLVAGLTGWETEPLSASPERRELIAKCVDRIEEMRSGGFSSMLDPCPMDLGRDVTIAAEVAARTGFNIIVATGLYNAELGAPYWRLRQTFDPDMHLRLAELFVAELTEGVGDTGLRAGVIKVATGIGVITPYERAVLEAAAIASNETDAPITTHTDAVLGDEQAAILKSFGVPSHRIIIGHCCGSRDHAYHKRIVDEGTYIGFDRFGSYDYATDEDRLASLVAILRTGAVRQVIVSHDSLVCSRGLPGVVTHSPLTFTRKIAPMLQAYGFSDEEVDIMLVENPKRYFDDIPFDRFRG